MLRGHFKSFAIHSLITVLVASPVLAASPGSAARRAATLGNKSRQTASAKESQGQIGNVLNASGVQSDNQRSAVRQVVGKQPVAPKTDPNRRLTLLPNFLRNSGRQPTSSNSNSNANGSRTGSQARSRTNSSTSSNRTSGNANHAVQTTGLLSDLFGGRSSKHKKAARPAKSPPPTVDWEGIPYHQARSKPSTQSQTPIRDPRPGETRIASPSRLTRQSTAPTLASPSVPKPPALAPSPSSRRSTPAKVVSNRVQRSESPVLSTLSSSRRSGRRDVPTLDASEIAAAKASTISKEELVPKVSRRDLTPETKPAAETVAKTKPAEPKATPAADVAVKPQSKPTPAAEKIAQAPTAVQTPAASPPSVALPEASAQPAATAKAIPLQTPVAADSIAAATPTPQLATAAPSPLAVASPSDTPLAADPAPQASETPAIPQIAAAPSNVGSQQQPPSIFTQPAPAAPQFVAPQLPPPSPPRFGPDGSVVGHRSGPPASAFQSRVAPRAALNPSSVPFGPAGSPIGSGVVQNMPAPAPIQPPVAPMQRPSPSRYRAPGNYTTPGTYTTPGPYASQPQRAPAGAYQRDPYAPAAPQPTHQIAQQQTRPAVPSNVQRYTQPNNTQRSTASPYGVMPQPPQTRPAQQQPYGAPAPSIIAAPGSSLGSPRASTPSALTHSPPRPSTEPPAARNADFDRSGQSAFSQTPFQAPPKPRAVASRPTTGELPQGQTAVASELPGIRVVTHGPSSVIIRQAHEFEIRVENRGSIDAKGVMIRASVPDWADVKGQTTSRGNVENQHVEESDRLVWTLDSLPAGTTEKMFIRLQALQSGVHELDVDWTLVPQKSVAKIEVREPKLDLVIEGPEQIVYGESQSYKVRVLNPGDGDAANVVFTLSPNSSTPQTQRIGNIPRGKEAQFEVELTAQDLGDLKIHGLAAGEMGLKAQAEKTIRVSAAELEAVLAGPEMQYQNTDAMYHLQITNNGSATCKNINAALALPPGIRYQGGIDIARKRGTKLTWIIDSLPPGAMREYEFNCTMVSPGKQTFDFAAGGSAAGKTAVALDTQVESIADLVMTIQDPSAPAPVGSEVTYEILIRNRGSRQATGVRAIAQFSNGIEPRRIEGHSGQVLTGQVLFDPIDKILPGEEIRIRVIAEAQSEGHHRFRTEIRSGETVLVAEEATQYLSKRGQRISRRSISSAR